MWKTRVGCISFCLFKPAQDERRAPDRVLRLWPERDVHAPMMENVKDLAVSSGGAILRKSSTSLFWLMILDTYLGT